MPVLVDKNGCVSFDDRADSEEIEGLIDVLVYQGFVAQVSDLGCEGETTEQESTEAARAGSRYYIAYGSNLDLSQMKVRCPTASPVGTGVLRNYHLLFRGSKTGAYLTVEPKKNSRVPVAVFTVEPEDEEALDLYEGCPMFYYKKDLRIPVELLDGSGTVDLDCFIYIMHEDRPLGCPSSRYVDVCSRGYRDFGFDKNYLANAILTSIQGGGRQNMRVVKTTAKAKVVK